jgi:hypothetical protein
VLHAVNADWSTVAVYSIVVHVPFAIAGTMAKIVLILTSHSDAVCVVNSISFFTSARVHFVIDFMPGKIACLFTPMKNLEAL